MIFKQIILKAGGTKNRAASFDNAYNDFKEFLKVYEGTCNVESLINCIEQIEKNDSKACNILNNIDKARCRILEDQYLIPFSKDLARLQYEYKNLEYSKKLMRYLVSMLEVVFDDSKLIVAQPPTVRKVIDDFTNTNPVSEIGEYCKFILSKLSVLKKYNEECMKNNVYPNKNVYYGHLKTFEVLEAFCRTANGSIEYNIYKLRYDILNEFIDSFNNCNSDREFYLTGIDEDLIDEVDCILGRISLTADKYGVIPTIDYKAKIFNNKHNIM